MTGSPELARTASTVAAVATAAVVMAQAADAGVSFTFQGRSADGADNWAVADGHIAVFGDGSGYGDGRVSIRLADIDSGTNLVGRRRIAAAGPDRGRLARARGRLETEWPATEADRAALTNLSGTWVDRVHGRRPWRHLRGSSG